MSTPCNYSGGLPYQRHYPRILTAGDTTKLYHGFPAEDFLKFLLLFTNRYFLSFAPPFVKRWKEKAMRGTPCQPDILIEKVDKASHLYG
jgi:hypothetical protein